MAITIITGINGSGKSYEMVCQGLEYLDSGRRVYANFHWYTENVYRWLRLRRRRSHKEAIARIKNIYELRDYADIFNATDSKILIDEAGEWFPARQHRVLPASLINYLRQHRKFGNDMVMCVQDMAALDSQLRVLAKEMFWARPAPFWIKLAYIPLVGVKRARRVIKYTGMLDESEGVVKSKGSSKGMARNRTRVLDFLAASCYDTMSLFPSPFERAQGILDPKAASIARQLNVEFNQLTLASKRRSEMAKDGLPVLTVQDIETLREHGIKPHEVLANRIVAHIEALNQEFAEMLPPAFDLEWVQLPRGPGYWKHVGTR